MVMSTTKKAYSEIQWYNTSLHKKNKLDNLSAFLRSTDEASFKSNMICWETLTYIPENVL